MNKLVIIRVGEPTLWQISVPLGRWSSPESQIQTVRNLIVEGYNVIALFVERGDLPLAAVKINSVRERTIEDAAFPMYSDLGDFRTFLEFDQRNIMHLRPTFTVTHFSSIDYIKYKVGSQLLIPQNFAREFIHYYIHIAGTLNLKVPLNTTYIVPPNVNYII